MQDSAIQEEPTVLAGDPVVVHGDSMHIRIPEFVSMARELEHLRVQRDELQALNTRLHNDRNGERVARLAAEEQATSLQMRVDALNIAVADWRERVDKASADVRAVENKLWSAEGSLKLAWQREREAKKRADDADRATNNVRADWHRLRDATRNILGATSEESLVEAARWVVAERDNYWGLVSDNMTETDALVSILGAGDAEPLLDAAKRVVAERDGARAQRSEAERQRETFVRLEKIARDERDTAIAKAQQERERANEWLVQAHDANKRADAAERLAHEAEAQREAAVRERDEAKTALVRQSALIHRLQEAAPERFAAAVYAAGNDAIDAVAAPLDLSSVRIDHVDVPVRRVGWSAPHNLPLPAYAKPGDAGLDLRARVDPKEPLWIKGGERAVIPCGFAFAIPEGYEGQVRPRSGMSRDGIVCSLGTIDSGYRGEVKVILTNTNREAFPVRLGDRIAQLVVSPIARATLHEVDALDETERSDGGFGSTGK